MVFTLDFQTTHNQFYISSDNANAALASAGFQWSNTEYNNRLGISKNFISVYPESYGHIKGELYLLDRANENKEYDTFDHIVEGGLNADSGLLQILDCPTSTVQLEIKVKPSIYRVRIYFSNMAGYDSDEDESNDTYIIEVWPSDDLEVKVLKNFPRIV